MGRSVLKLVIGGSVDLFYTDEDQDIRQVIQGNQRSEPTPFVDPNVSIAQDNLRRAQDELRRSQISAYVNTPVEYLVQPDPKAPGRQIRVPIKRPTPTPGEIAQLFPVATPPGTAGPGIRSIFKGTITAPDGTVTALYEPEGGEAFVRTRAPGETEFGPGRTLFGGSSVEIRKVSPASQATRESAPPTPTAASTPAPVLTAPFGVAVSPEVAREPTLFEKELALAFGRFVEPSPIKDIYQQGFD